MISISGVLVAGLLSRPITPESVTAAVNAVAAEVPVGKPEMHKDTPNLKRLRWSMLMAAGVADAVSTDLALRRNPNTHENGLIARHLIKGPVSVYVVTLGIKAGIAWLLDKAAKEHDAQDVTVSAGVMAGYTAISIVGNVQLAKKGGK